MSVEEAVFGEHVEPDTLNAIDRHCLLIISQQHADAHAYCSYEGIVQNKL